MSWTDWFFCAVAAVSLITFACGWVYVLWALAFDDDLNHSLDEDKEN